MDRRLIIGELDEECGLGGALHHPIDADTVSTTSSTSGIGCPECKSHSTHGHNSSMSTRRKLLCLLFIASLSLLSIVLISEQLIVRHMERNSETGLKAEVVELDILTLEEWATREAGSNRNQFQHHELTVPRPVEIVEDGVFWSSSLEAKISPGPSDQAVQNQIHALRQRKVARLARPDWVHCGREKNRFVEFSDGGHACARNRDAHAEYVQGEVMAFYLARLLGINNTPAVALSKVTDGQWDAVKDSMVASNWTSESIVALIQWIPDLTKDTMPTILRETLLSGESATAAPSPVGSDSRALVELAETDPGALEKLVQWSDLIIFDYITGNYDRVASMQDGANKEKRPSILRETIHNLALSTETSSLWFIDNESAFLSAYSLIYGGEDKDSDGRFAQFHTRMLRTNCVFRRSTVHRLFALAKSADPSKLLLRFVSDNEPLFVDLPTIHENSLFASKFRERLSEVWDWVSQCQRAANYDVEREH